MKKLIFLLPLLLMISVTIFSQAKPEQINVGSSPNDKTGDPIRTSFQKTNRNMTAIWDTAGNHMILIIRLEDSVYNYNIRLSNNATSIAGIDDRVTVTEDSVNNYDVRISSDKVRLDKPEIAVQVLCSDTILITPDETGYILAIGDALDGTNLIKVEAFYGESQGDRVPTVNIFRKRSSTEVQMTTTGANFTTEGVINTSYDDVVTGDRIKAAWTIASGTTMPYGMMVQLTFKKP